MPTRRDSPIAEERARVTQARAVHTPLDDMIPSAPFEFGALDVLPLPRGMSRAIFGEPEVRKPRVVPAEVLRERPGVG